MAKNTRLVIEVAAPILLTVGVSVATDRATGQRSVQWTYILIVLLSALVVAGVLARRREQREKDPDAPHPAGLTKGEAAVASGAAVVLLGSVSFAVVQQINVDTSCRLPAVKAFSDLPYECDIDWSALDDSRLNVETDREGSRTVPIYKMRRRLADESMPEVGTVDFLSRRTGVRQFFACDTEGERSTTFDGLSEKGTPRWALTRGDKTDVWGWMPEVFLPKGQDGDDDELIRECTDTEKGMGGQRYKA